MTANTMANGHLPGDKQVDFPSGGHPRSGDLERYPPRPHAFDQHAVLGKNRGGPDSSL